MELRKHNLSGVSLLILSLLLGVSQTPLLAQLPLVNHSHSRISIPAAKPAVAPSSERTSDNETRFFYEIPFEMRSGRMYVLTRLNGREYTFLFDTGASGYGRVDSALVEELEIPIIGQSTNSDGITTSMINDVRIEEMRIGNLKVENAVLNSRNYNAMRKNKHSWVYGIIGQAFWEDYVLTIDFPGRKLIFTDASLNKNDAGTVRYSGHLEIDLQVGNIKTKGNIDTGSAVSLHLPMHMTDNIDIQELKRSGTGKRAYTTFHLYTAILNNDVLLADQQVSQVRAHFSEEINHVNIGMGLLQHFVVSIDQKNKLIRFLRPSAP